MANDLRDSSGALRSTNRGSEDAYDGGDSFVASHQTMKIAMKPRKTPEWTKYDAKIREVLLRSFPKLVEQKATSIGNKQRKRAGVWIRFIQLYWRDERRTLAHIAQDMKMSLEAAKSLRVRIERAGRGVRCDGRGARRRSS